MKKNIKALVLNPQQEEFLKYYLDVNSETFGNAYRSALKAKYKEEYAQNITHRMPNWLSESVGDAQLLQKAVENIKNFLEMDISNTGVTKRGDTFEFDDAGKLRIKADITKFVAERIGKKRFGQERPNTIIPIQINFKDEDLQ